MTVVTTSFDLSKNRSLRSEFEPWLQQTARVCEQLLEHDTWMFDFCEQSIVGVFGTAATQIGILPFYETEYYRVNDLTPRSRLDLWLATKPETLFEFKVATWKGSSDNLKTRLKKARNQLRHVAPDEEVRTIAVVTIAYHREDFEKSQPLQDKVLMFARRCGDVIVNFEHKDGRSATAFFKEVRRCSLKS